MEEDAVCAHHADLIEPARTVACSMNQRLPSGPVVMDWGRELTGYSLNEPSGAMKPTRAFLPSVNQTFPSGPNVMPPTDGATPGSGYSVTEHRLVLAMQDDELQACEPMGHSQIEE